MPITTIRFTSGINRELTNYSNKGGFYNSEKIRFRSGSPEKLGGWQNANTSSTFNGVARTLTTWEASDGTSLLAFGTNQKYYIAGGNSYSTIGVFNDITPLNATTPTATLTNPFSTTSGSPLVTVTDSTPITVGTFISYSGATAVGGITINGSYEVISVIGGGYTILASSNATSAAGPGGGTVTATYKINSTAPIDVSPSGWGISTWGTGYWGIGGSNTTC